MKHTEKVRPEQLLPSSNQLDGKLIGGHRIISQEQYLQFTKQGLVRKLKEKGC